MWNFQSAFIFYIILVKFSVKTNANTWHSFVQLCNTASEFIPFDVNDHLSSVTVSSSTSCGYKCALTTHCRTFNYNSQMQQCQLFQGDINTVGSIISSNSSHSICGSVVLTNQNFVNYGHACSYCSNSQYLTCMNSTCQCYAHDYFDGSICRSQKRNGSACSNDIECRNDMNLICLSNMYCGYSHNISLTTTTLSTTTTTQTTTSSSTSTTTQTTTTSSTSTSTTTLSTSTTTKTTTGSTTTAPATYLLTSTNETVYGVWKTVAGGDSTAARAQNNSDCFGQYSPSESVANVFDNNMYLKYLNFGNCTCSSPDAFCALNTGFYFSPVRGLTQLQGIGFCTPGDESSRDPITITIEGTNATNTSVLVLGSSWTLFYNGSSGLNVDPGRGQCGPIQNFTNTMWYKSYRVLVTAKRSSSDCVQYAEVKLMGY